MTNNDEGTGELKPCPFCGNSDFFFDKVRDANQFFIGCNVCECCGPLAPSELKAEYTWNDRQQAEVSK